MLFCFADGTRTANNIFYYFNDVLTLCSVLCGGQAVDKCTAIVDQGDDNMEQFAAMILVDVDRLVKQFVVKAAPPALIPFRAVKKLKTMCRWMEWHQRTPEPVLYVQFVMPEVDWVLSRMNEEQRVGNFDAETPARPDTWTKMSALVAWLDVLDSYASQVRGAAFLPSKYVDCDHVTPTAEKETVADDNTDEQLMTRVQRQGADFMTANNHLSDLLVPLIRDGPGWVWMKSFA